MKVEKMNDKKIQACIGWLYVGMLPQYIQRLGVSVASVKAMEDARVAVARLEAAGQIGPLEAAFGLKAPDMK